VSETLMDIMAEESAQTSDAETTSDTTPTEPSETTAIETPSESVAEETSSESPAEETAAASEQLDDFIREASEATGMDLSDLKDKDRFFQSYANLRRKASERDELARLGQAIVSSEFAPKVFEMLQGKAEQAPEPSAPAVKADEIPEWDPSWEEIVQSENAPPEIVAKYRRRQQWAKQRAESLITSESLQKLAADPEGFIRDYVQPLLEPVQQAQQQTAEKTAQQQMTARVKAVLAPVEKQVFTGEWGDWNSVTPFGEKVRQRFESNPALSQADPVGRLQECIDIEKTLMPQPNPTKVPAPTSARAPNAGQPPLDPKSVEKTVDEAQAKNPNMSVAELDALYRKLRPEG